MLPIVLTDSSTIGLAGQGEALARRATLLAEAGLKTVAVSPGASLDGFRFLFVAGLPADEAAALARRARAAGILVNVEDVPEFCDFHVPAIVRRGELMLTASTGGQAPGLARRLREWLEERFGPEWKLHMEDVSSARAGWRAEGLEPQEVSRRTRELVTEKGWLQ
ncbi:MAG TPA: NAD(P)-dependent oxidoreductase [Rhizomicrobium sp.]|nr:NAD(P)-dependent oxidoreductase [Rhizomicrobium sp.]